MRITITPCKPSSATPEVVNTLNNMAPIKTGTTSRIPSYMQVDPKNCLTSSSTFTQTYKLKPMTKKELIQTARGRNRSKQPSELQYYLFVMLIGVIVGVAIVDLVVNNQII